MIYIMFYLMYLSVNNKRKDIHTMLHNVVILHVYFNDWENPIKTTLTIYRICILSIYNPYLEESAQFQYHDLD